MMGAAKIIFVLFMGSLHFGMGVTLLFNFHWMVENFRWDKIQQCTCGIIMVWCCFSGGYGLSYLVNNWLLNG